MLAGVADARAPRQSSGTGDGIIIQRTLTVGALERRYCLHMPPHLAEPRAAVFMFHGGGAPTCRNGEIGERWIRKADAEGFLLVMPLGVDGGWNACAAPPELCRELRPASKANTDDVGFFKAMRSQVMDEFGIRKVYATGISLGGMFTYLLACQNPRLIDAFAPVAATSIAQDCPGGPVPMLHMHGGKDERVPWPDGGGSRRQNWPSPLAGILERAKKNGCSSQNPVQQFKDSEHHLFTGCEAETEYWINNCKHGWPGIDLRAAFWARCTESFHAEDVMWDFFKRN